MGQARGGRVVRMGLAGFLIASAWGCYEHTVTVGAGAPAAPVVVDQWESFWLGGLIGHVDVDVARICPSGDATIVAKQTFLNGFVSALTSGIYTPTTLRVRCRGGRGGRGADVELSAQDVAQLVREPAFAAWVGHDAPERMGEVTAALETLAEHP